ncbi:PQQ-binding-like beta-propeller repeat protein [Halobacteria archaeon HArc-gm2]|nr:PQQ-binding-like beta-propeller repeat protein [Halobacteria archaeon HArc-gm2]
MSTRRTFIGTIGAAIGATGFATAVSGQTSNGTSQRNGATSAADPTDWPRFKFDSGNTGYNPAGTAPQTTPETLWTAENGIYGDQTQDPCVAGGLVYDARQSTNDQTPGVWAFDAESGEEVWSAELTQTPRTIVAADGSLHVATSMRLIKLDAETGERLEQRLTADEIDATPPVVAPPAVADGTLYVLNNDRNTITAVDVESYDQLWQTDRNVDETPPAVAGGSVFFESDHRVAELDAANGGEQRVFEFDLVRAPVVSDGVLYAATEGALDAYDLDTGDRIWRYVSDEVRRYYPTSPVVDDDRVYVSDGQPNTPLVALDAATGSVEWRFTDDAACGRRDWEPGVARVGDLLVTANSKGTFYGIDPSSGEMRWRYHTDAVDPWSSRTLVDFAVADGHIYAQFHGENGTYDEIHAIGVAGGSE